MSRKIACPCGMLRHDGVMNCHSHEWHVAHKARHLAVFPDVDRQTIDCLDFQIERAAELAREGSPA